MLLQVQEKKKKIKKKKIVVSGHSFGYFSKNNLQLQGVTDVHLNDSPVMFNRTSSFISR